MRISFLLGGECFMYSSFGDYGIEYRFVLYLYNSWTGWGVSRSGGLAKIYINVCVEEHIYMVSSRFIASLFVRCALYSRCAACSSYTAIQNEHQKSTKSTTSIYLYKIYISVYPHRVRIQTVNWRMISQHQQPTTHDFWFQNNLKPAVSGRVVRFPLFKTWNTI